ncbi:hypothetical protein ACTHR6_13015 [Ralstonia holmesii]|uniref:Uncharacterized protein n=1 Tax=Ralstonia holmesii TaxID=3058602 RepID=A0ABC8QHE2_9RALS|nr:MULTISPECIES: hypothetical protein [Ralstonia]CAJ0795153.1 hypothetical protein LMG18096_03074 [Ralstonia sp. LMG 32967]CAJ0812480.1 hypothetical protein LMG18093_01682 [Ralstonia sp. LMG 32967]
MLLSSLVPQLLPPSPAAMPRAVAMPASRHVCLRVTVPGDAPHAIRRQLHALLGDTLGLYIVRHDARRKAITVDLELAHADVDAVIGALLRGLPCAMLGRITPLCMSHKRAIASLH